jgi:hypothetical protein
MGRMSKEAIMAQKSGGKLQRSLSGELAFLAEFQSNYLPKTNEHYWSCRYPQMLLHTLTVN